MKETFDLRELRENPKNPYPFTGSQDKWEAFKSKLDSNDVFCEANRIAYDSTANNLIIAGNKRAKAFIELGRHEIPKNWVFDCKDWTEEQRREYIVASNKNWGEWAQEILEMDFEDLAFDYDLIIKNDFDFNEEEEPEDEDNNEKTQQRGEIEDEPSFSIRLDFTEDDFRRISDKLNAMQGSKEGIIYDLVMAA